MLADTKAYSGFATDDLEKAQEQARLHTGHLQILNFPVDDDIAWFKDPAGNILSVLKEP